MSAWLLAAVLAGVPPARSAQGDARAIDGHAYEKLETRAATYERMRALLQPEHARWGAWHLLSAFPYAGHGQDDLATELAPEAELARMAANGPGPDLSAVWAGKQGVEARWRPLGDVEGRRVELHVFEEPEFCDLVCCYLYTTVTAKRAVDVEVDCGSDDGLRLWLNGSLLVDHDVPRGLDPEDEHLTLRLEAGVNHLLAKVAKGGGDWAFQLNARRPLPGPAQCRLQYWLDLDFPPTPERAHYRVLGFPLPEELVLEVGGIAFLGDGTPLVATRRGDVLAVRGAYDEPPAEARFELFAAGLHEPLGLGVRRDPDGVAVYAVQRAELTRLRDEDGDGRADLYEAFCDGWGVSGNYHEFAFGPEFDDEGNAWVTLNVGFCGSIGKSPVPWRGWALKIDRAGRVTPVCCGLRSPNGIGRFSDGAMFYVDNQGDYVATNRLSLLAPGLWHGHPASLRWRDDLDGPDARPPRQPASVWFPYDKMGQSAADVELDDTGGAFGPFAGQLFVGDQTHASVMRVFLEQVEGHYQGACFPFLAGLECGVNRVEFAPDGSLFVGETDRGWGSIGRRSYGLQRVVYTGEAPFEIRAMRARADGFELEFTLPVDPATAAAPGSYQLSSYTYEYHSAYGAPEEDTQELGVASAVLLDAQTVRLSVPGLRHGYVHELHADGVRSASGAALLHDEAYYTLVRIPGPSPEDAAPSALPRVLFLTHSAGFVHEVVKRADPYVLAHAEERLIDAAAGRFDVQATQDCGRLSRSLADVEAVVFYTTGELPLDEPDRAALMNWIEQGGALVGVHCATDTLYEYEPYVQMIGGTFDGHPWHQEVAVRVEDPAHPATLHLEPSFRITDEIYQFKNFDRSRVHVLLSLDPTSVDVALGGRADGDYALAWCRELGRGRVFYTALGHRPEVWEDPRFLEHLLGGIAWAIGPPAPGPEGAR